MTRRRFGGGIWSLVKVLVCRGSGSCSDSVSLAQKNCWSFDVQYQSSVLQNMSLKTITGRLEGVQRSSHFRVRIFSRNNEKEITVPLKSTFQFTFSIIAGVLNTAE
jgi:hypothetical protein